MFSCRGGCIAAKLSASTQKCVVSTILITCTTISLRFFETLNSTCWLDVFQFILRQLIPKCHNNSKNIKHLPFVEKLLVTQQQLVQLNIRSITAKFVFLLTKIAHRLLLNKHHQIYHTDSQIQTQTYIFRSSDSSKYKLYFKLHAKNE